MITPLVDELRIRADGYRQSGPSAEHTAALLDRAASTIESLSAQCAQSQAGEPVAWQNIDTPSSILTPEQYGMRLPLAEGGFRPLYASPQPANPAQGEPVANLRLVLARLGELNRGDEAGIRIVLANVIDALTAAIGAGGQAVAVKPLEWTEDRDDDGTEIHRTRGGEVNLPYTVYEDGFIKKPFGVSLNQLRIGSFDTIAEAKAAAQADYERRILSALSHPVQPGWRSCAAGDVLSERQRQVEAEGWTPEHDDAHTEGELAAAATCYAFTAVRNGSSPKPAEPPLPMEGAMQGETIPDEIMREARAWGDRAYTDMRDKSIDEIIARALMVRDKRAAEKIEDLEDILHRIKQWCEAYPIDIFPEPDFKRAHELLTAGGITLDAISASNMRHVVTQIAKMIPARHLVEKGDGRAS